MKTTLTFYADGTFHCDGLGKIRTILIGGGLLPGEKGCDACPRFVKCGMSHTSEVASTIKDFAAIKAACKALGLKEPKLEEAKMFDGKKYTGYVVHLKDWSYPIVIDPKTGAIHYDNYNGSWGKEVELKKFRQAYGLAKAKMIAKKHGYFIKTFTLPNGSVKLQVTGV